MDTYRQLKLSELRKRIERGEYAVDPDRVAGSIMRCVSALELARRDARPAPALRHGRTRRRGVRGLPRRGRSATAALS